MSQCPNGASVVPGYQTVIHFISLTEVVILCDILRTVYFAWYFPNCSGENTCEHRIESRMWQNESLDNVPFGVGGGNFSVACGRCE